MMQRDRLPETISIFAVGIIACSGNSGVLFAPKSGRETSKNFYPEGGSRSV